MAKKVFQLTGGAFPPFAWRLPQEIAAYKQARLPAGQWVHVIKGFAQKGIKQSEIDDAKVLDWLETHGKDQITREEVADYVSYSLPSIKEARLTGRDVHYREYSWTKAGEDYNESLFYFPTVTEDLADRIADLDDAIAALNFNFEALGRDPDAVFRLDKRRAALFAQQDEVARGVSLSTHFSTRLQEMCPDARADFAHMRWSVLTLDGHRTLFVHEFQSDWAQKGRAEALRIQRKEMWDALKGQFDRMTVAERVLAERMPLNNNPPDIEKGLDELFEKYVGTLPGAPEWKGTYKKAPLVFETEYWTAFLLRRAMLIAVEQDCSQLTWINGSKMANGGQFGTAGLDEFYQKIVPSIAKKLARPFESELCLKDFTIKGQEKRLAVMPVSPAMKEKFANRAPVYSYARLVAKSTYDPVRAAQLEHALQLRANDTLGKEAGMRVSVVREVLAAHEEQRPAAALVGKVALVAFNADDPVAALDHEGFHFAYRHYFTSKQKNDITRQFSSGSPLLVRTVRLLLSHGEFAGAQQAMRNPEEAAAHAYSLWRKGQMALSRVEGLAMTAEAKAGASRILTQYFPVVQEMVRSVCTWIRGTSVSPTDFLAKIVRAHERGRQGINDQDVPAEYAERAIGGSVYPETGVDEAPDMAPA